VHHRNSPAISDHHPMSDELLDKAADIIATARTDCLKLGVSPTELAELFLDDAVLGLAVEGRSRRDTSQFFRDYGIPHWYAFLPERNT
jgi:hypothetical protein